MNDLLTKKFDSEDDESDEDYVPIEKNDDKEDDKKNSKKFDKKYEEKQKKKIEEIWKDMNFSDKNSVTSKGDSIDNNNKNTPDDKNSSVNISEILKKINNNSEDTKDRLVAYAGKVYDAKGKKIEAPNVLMSNINNLVVDIIMIRYINRWYQRRK